MSRSVLNCSSKRRVGLTLGLGRSLMQRGRSPNVWSSNQPIVRPRSRGSIPSYLCRLDWRPGTKCCFTCERARGALAHLRGRVPGPWFAICRFKIWRPSACPCAFWAFAIPAGEAGDTGSARRRRKLSAVTRFSTRKRFSRCWPPPSGSLLNPRTYRDNRRRREGRLPLGTRAHS